MKFLADENLDNDILEGVFRRNPNLDLVRVQDVGLISRDDPTVLAWAAEEGRILLTHDIRTIPAYAYERVRAGLPMAGVIEINRATNLGQVIEDILLIDSASEPSDWENQVHYLPFD